MVENVLFVKYANSYIPENMVYQGGDPRKQRPIVFGFYLLRVNSCWVLVDVGSEGISGFVLENFKSPLVALQEYGVSAEDVDAVIITHAHGDHIGAIRHFKNAEIYIQREEYVKGEKRIPSDFRVKKFDEEICVKEHLHVKKIGGHSVGSSVVEFEWNGQQYVICGDECYLRWNLDEKVITGCSVCKEKSTYFINKYSSDQYIPLLCHEPQMEE